jgi:hypothetical protein
MYVAEAIPTVIRAARSGSEGTGLGMRWAHPPTTRRGISSIAMPERSLEGKFILLYNPLAYIKGRENGVNADPSHQDGGRGMTSAEGREDGEIAGSMLVYIPMLLSCDDDGGDRIGTG